MSRKIYGGGDVHFSQLAKNISELGHNVGYMSASVGTGPYRYFRMSVIGAFKAALWSDCIYLRLRPTSRRPAWLMRSLRFLRLIFGIPLVWEINAPVAEGVILEKYGIDEQLSREKLTRRDAREVAAAFCVSRELVTYAREVLKVRNPVYVPNGAAVDHPSRAGNLEMREGGSSHEPTIFWMGSGALPWEGDRLAIATAQWMQENNVAGRVVIAGGERERYPELPENVLHIGKIVHEKVHEYLNSADICLCLYDLAYFSQTAFYQSPLKLYEYMAAGKPVIGTDAGEIRYTIDHGVDGLLVRNEPQCVGRAIVQLARNEGLRREMGAAARQKVLGYYNWNRVADDTISEIKKVSRQKRS